MNEGTVKQAYEIAKERYAKLGIDTDKVLQQMQDFHLSMHCWQADDVAGFENQGGSLTGGIQVNGNYPGKARNIDELRADILYAMKSTAISAASSLTATSALSNTSRAGSTGAKPMTSSSTSTQPHSLTRRAATSASRTPTRASVISGSNTQNAAVPSLRP